MIWLAFMIGVAFGICLSYVAFKTLQAVVFPKGLAGETSRTKFLIKVCLVNDDWEQTVRAVGTELMISHCEKCEGCRAGMVEAVRELDRL